MAKFWGWKQHIALFVFCAVVVISPSAQTFTTLANFDGSNGEYPSAGLVQGLSGNLYGTTTKGGANDSGTVFEISPAGKLVTLYSFCSQPNCSDGVNPQAGLVQGFNGDFYGTTTQGGAGHSGTVFEISAAGKVTTLYTFCAEPNCADGEFPASLVQATNGNFYGTTAGRFNFGTVFVITPAGRLTTLYTFCTQKPCTDGEHPEAGLVQATSGNFYGTTFEGGANNSGTIFEMTPAGKLTTLYSFCSQTNCTDGASPYAGLVQAIDGSLYGTTEYGGVNGNECFTGLGCGTVFEITAAGKLTTLYRFCSQANCPDGNYPYAGLVQATDGNLYGTTSSGGAAGGGTAFKITPRRQLTTLYGFCSQPLCIDGFVPYGWLVQGTNGILYGTTVKGGTGSNCAGYGCGTVFSLSVGLGPFAKTLPGAGKVGHLVGILGNNLTGATAVTFNGTPATFTVRSASLIVTNVPAGATTGTVRVTLPSGTLSSNVPFSVLK